MEKEEKIRKPWENYIRKVEPYTPGEQPDKPEMIKLNTNENPYPPSPKVDKAICDLKAERMRLYPDPAAKVLVKALAEYHHLSEDQVFPGVGSDDVLAISLDRKSVV